MLPQNREQVYITAFDGRIELAVGTVVDNAV